MSYSRRDKDIMWRTTTFLRKQGVNVWVDNEKLIPGTPMPWGAFARFTDDDLRAIYRYLRSLPPARNDVGPPVQPKAGD